MYVLRYAGQGMYVCAAQAGGRGMPAFNKASRGQGGRQGRHRASMSFFALQGAFGPQIRHESTSNDIKRHNSTPGGG